MFQDDSLKALPAGSILGNSEVYAKFALFALWQRLLPIEYREDNGKLVVVDVAASKREILQCLNKRDREFFLTHMVGNVTKGEHLLYGKDPVDIFYDRALHAWRALGTTVLLHPELTDDILQLDENLLLSCVKFKKWFFHSCFSGGRLDQHEGKPWPNWPGISNTITLIKRLSAWITYYSAFDRRVEKPNRIDPLPGSGKDHQEFTWFGGALSHYRYAFNLLPSKLTVLSLSQMSGFGRALPPATSSIAHENAEETMNLLSSKPEIDPFWVDAYGIAAAKLSSRLRRLPVETHCSINSTACYEATQEEGGLASFVVREVNFLMNNEFDGMVTHIEDMPECMYDPMGRVAIDPAICWRTNKRRSNFRNKGIVPMDLPPMPLAQGINRRILFGHIAYRASFLDPHVNNGQAWNLPSANPFGGLRYNRDLYEAFGDERYTMYNETLGDIVVLWAFSQAMEYGHFVDRAGAVVTPLFKDLALFREPGPKIWVQDLPVPAKLMALEEPGWKARTLTKNKAFVVILQALLRHPLGEVLASDGRVGFGLKSSYILWDFLKLVSKKRFDKSWYLISTDLSQSTDLIPHQILGSIWKNFLPGIGLSPNHPLICLRNMFMIKHVVIYKRPDRTVRMIDHTCGSFMGEPISFMGLDLYNLCVSEVAAFMAMRRIPRQIGFNLREFRVSGPSPSGYIAIVGDDRKELTNVPDMFEHVNYQYKVTNGKPSKGKNIVSSCHGMLAENHTYFDGDTIVYLDTIKPKLLTSSTRYHSDNQSSVIGKGSQLHVQLEWYASNKTSHTPVINSRVIYTISMMKGLFPKDIRRAMKLPIYLPTSVGGISFPTPIGDAYQYGYAFMKFVEWLLLDANIKEFLETSMMIRDISAGVKRGLPASDISKLWGTHFAKLIKDLNLANEVIFEPENVRGIFNLQSILNFVEANHKEIPISAVTGRPHVAMSMELISKKYGYLPIESMLDVIERQSTFLKAFSDAEGVTKKEKLSFHKYVVRAEKFWGSIEPKTSCPGVRRLVSWDQVHWYYGRRLKAFVHESVFGDDDFSSGPTLFLSTKRRKGVTRSKAGWESLKNHALSAYLARVRQEKEEIEPLVENVEPQLSPTTLKKWEVSFHSLNRGGRLPVR